MKRTLLAIATITTIAALPSQATAQAYCALRDPVKAIYSFYPEADSYRSIVRTVNEKTRSDIAEVLPFTLHFNELGRHTLYVPAKNAKPVGLVHVRSEAGPWGLAEIAWSLNPDLTIRDFSFQRCRSRAKREIEAETFRSQLHGKNKTQIRAFLTSDGQDLAPKTFPDLTPQARDLAAMVLRSSLKTIEVTRIAWQEDIETLNMLNHAYAAFPNGASVELFENLYSAEALSELNKQLGKDNETNINRAQTIAIRVKNSAGEVVGHVIRTPWASSGYKAILWWNITPELSITKIIPEGDWPSLEVEQAFLETEEINIDGIAHCQTAAQLVGAEVLVVSNTLQYTR